MTLSMLNRVELNKLLKRKDIWLILFMIAMPMLYAIGSYCNASFIQFKSVEKTYCMRFVVNMYQFVYAVYIFFFLTIFSVVKSFANEIDDKSIILYIPRCKNRMQVYLSKVISLSIVFTIITCIFYLVSIIMYYLFLIHRTDIAMLQFWKAQDTIYLIVNGTSIYLYFILLIHLSMLLSTYLKPTLTSVVSFLIITVTLYLQQMPYVQKLMPGYYINQFMDSSYFNTINSNKDIVAFYILILIYCAIFNTIGIKKFKRLDI